MLVGVNVFFGLKYYEDHAQQHSNTQHDVEHFLVVFFQSSVRKVHGYTRRQQHRRIPKRQPRSPVRNTWVTHILFGPKHFGIFTISGHIWRGH